MSNPTSQLPSNVPTGMREMEHYKEMYAFRMTQAISCLAEMLSLMESVKPEEMTNSMHERSFILKADKIMRNFDTNLSIAISHACKAGKLALKITQALNSESN